MSKLHKLYDTGDGVTVCPGADEWELCPVTAGNELMPALFLHFEDKELETVGIRLDVSGCIEIAAFLNDYALQMLSEDKAKEITSFAEGLFGSREYSKAYAKMKDVVMRDMAFETDRMKALARHTGLIESKGLIGKLAKAASMDDGDAKMAIMESLLPEIESALA